VSACGARTRLGQPCRLPALVGATRCRMHGGASPQARSAARLRVVEQQALAVLDRESIIAPLVDPVSALQELAGEALQLKRYFADRLSALEQLRYEGRAGEQLRAEVALFERALDRAQKFALDLAKLGLEDRLVALSESQGRMLAQVIEAALEACGLSDRLDLRHEIAQQLRLAAPTDESLPTRAVAQHGLAVGRRRLGPLTTREAPT
jgi:hypothetical protein